MKIPRIIGLVASGAAAAAAASAATLPAEAIATVDGAVTAGPERNRGLIAAFGADNRVHLAGTPVKTEAVGRTVGTPRLSARGAPLGLVRVSLLSMIRLIVG